MGITVQEWLEGIEEYLGNDEVLYITEEGIVIHKSENQEGTYYG